MVGVEQRGAVGQRGVGRELAVHGAVFQPAGREAEGGDKALKSAQVVVDDGLAGERDDATVGEHGIRLGAVAHAAVLELAGFVGLQQIRGAGQLHDVHGFEIWRVGCAAGPKGVGAGVLVIRGTQALVGHVGEQAGEVAGAHHAAAAEVQHARCQRQAVHAFGALTMGFQEGAAHFQQAHAAEAAAVVVELRADADAVQDGLLDAGQAHLHFVLHGFDARGDVAVATRGGVAPGELGQDLQAGVGGAGAGADHAGGELRHAVAGAQVGDVGGAGVGGGRGGLRGLCRRGGAACGDGFVRHGASFFSWGFGGCAHRGRLLGCGRLGGLLRDECALGTALGAGGGAGSGGGIERDGDEAEFGGLPVHSAVQRQGAAVGAVGGADDFVLADVVADADVFDDAGFDVAHQACDVFAVGQAHGGAAFGAVDPGALDNANDVFQLVGVVRVEHGGLAVVQPG